MQLCINQTSIPERTQQVKPMHEIYVEADWVVVWFGPEDAKGDPKNCLRSDQAAWFGQHCPLDGRQAAEQPGYVFIWYHEQRIAA
jgi:hypothetical protein